MAWVGKTDERCVPESGVLGHQFVVFEGAGSFRSLTWPSDTLKRWEHDEFTHDINRGVSAGRVSGRGVLRIEEALSGYLPEVDSATAAGCPARLAMAMRYSVLGGGKRLRPVLVPDGGGGVRRRAGGGDAGGLCPGDGSYLFADP